MKEYYGDVQSRYEKLPPEYKQESSDFIEFLLHKKQASLQSSLQSGDDPILKLIGDAQTQPFADKIDQQLYGEQG